ncbi:uncharacterized protein LOC111126617 [Crassostrea virginica]
MGTFITYQLVVVILVSWRSCLSLPDRDSDTSHPGHVVLHPPSNLTTVYVGDGDVYFYWSPPQNYRTHNPKPLLETEVSKIHNIDHVHFSDSGTWHDKEFGTGTYNSDKYWALDFFSDLRHLHKKFRGIGNSDSQSDHGLTTPSNKTVEEHIVQSNLTEEQMDIVRQHYASKNISDVPNWFQKTTVPKEHAGIMFYTVFWQEMINGTEGEILNATVEASKLDYHIKDLKALTDYRISVEVTYFSFTTLRSEYLEVTTNRNYSLIHTEDFKDVCHCNELGTSSGSSECLVHHFGTLTLSLCHCKEGYSGMYCHICASGYYRLGPNMPCYKCPCGPLKSNGHCHFEEGYLFCDSCKEPYTGNLCQACATGYYRPKGSTKCTPCNCHGNAHICQDITGECIGCLYNTAGFNCNRCQHGYVEVRASQFSHPKCVLASTVDEMKQKEERNSISSGAIAGICVAIIILVGIVVGIVIYKRYWRYPTARPFWTVELKDDHEGISFSSVPEDELVAITAREEEEEAYQSMKRGKPSNQPYAKLRENI